jgi:ATP-binding cassette subfamily F protein uup
MDVNDERVYIPSYLSRFLFDRSTIHMPMANLSGGERNRVDLAKKFLRGGNVLVLDEPTNDLDLYTLRVLEEAVLGFDGAALLVSHDRYFLNRVCTHVIAFEGDGNLVLVAGNFDDYQRYREEKDAEERRVERAARPAPPQRPAEPKPRRLTYKEQKELEGIEDAIAAAEAEAARLEAAIGDPGLYAKPQDAIQAALAEHEAARARVEALYERWSALEDIAAGGAG